MKRTQMIVKRNVSEQMVLTVRISCSGTWAGSLMIVGPMHEEMSFKIDVSRDQESRSRSSRSGARSTRFKSHSDHCSWSKISNDGMSGEELIDIHKMVKLVAAARTIPEDMQMPRFGRNRRRK